ncbi:hypothetical protein DL767_004922 [Monosporascus sp. MG133]|nr:hypothetical protein DL767_004922 [Monosporascus sp. MG133]
MKRNLQEENPDPSNVTIANPDVPFINGIAPHGFKPAFVAGTAVTGTCFIGAVCAMHHVCHRFKSDDNADSDDDDPGWRRAAALLVLASGLTAAVSLLLLSVFDTRNAHVRHRHLLMGTFGTLAACAVATTAVWWNQIWGPSPIGGCGNGTCILNPILVASQLLIGLAFVVLSYSGFFLLAGIMEWALTYLGAFWTVSFVGYTSHWFKEGDGLRVDGDEERPPLG